MIAADKFCGKTVGVFGLGRTGLAVVEALQAGGANVWAFDDSERACESAAAAGVPIVDLQVADFAQMDSYVLSPGVPLTHPKPHWSVEKARAAGVEIIGDTEVFVRQIAGTKARLVAITGTNGKSTTTALIGHVLSQCGFDVEVGGNIGTAVFLLGPPVAGKIYVLEMSSYQIDLTPSLHADVAVLMNVSPDHIDRHGTFENYAAVKARIFAHQAAQDTAVISVDDAICRQIAEGLYGARVVKISVEQKLADGVSAIDGVLRSGDDVIDLGDMAGLRGKHNWQNACATFATGRAFGLVAGDMAQAMASFTGLVHRMEQVGRIDKVVFVNDSKATNADASAHALATFEPIYWIAGGRSKQGGIESLRRFFPRIARAYLIGEAADDFAATLDGEVPVEMCHTLDVAVARAARDARKERAGEPVVLLSPACASFDQYASFDVRGDAFRELVADLDGIELVKGVAA